MARPRGERGQTTLLIVGLAVVLLMMAAVVTDASAAYLQRQGLDAIADGAALTAADAAASSVEVYGSGIGTRLHLDPARARAAVSSYLRRIRATSRYRGLTARVGVDQASGRVTVRVTAPIRLPLKVPGSPARATVSATSTAAVGVNS